MGQLKILLYGSFLRMRFLPLWVPWSVFSVLPIMNTLFVVSSPLGQPDSRRLIPLLIQVLAIPAVISGSTFALKELLEKDRVAWRDFFHGMAKYYWRIVGGFLSLAGVILLFGLVFSRLLVFDLEPYLLSDIWALGLTGFQKFAPIIVLALAANYLLFMWLSALVMEDTGVFEAARLSASFAIRYAKSLLPVCVIAWLFGWGIKYLDPISDLTSLGWQSLDVAYVMLVAFIGASLESYFRIVAFNLYHRKKTIVPVLTERSETLTPPTL